MYGFRPSIPQNCLPYISMVLHTCNQNHFYHDAVFFTLFTNKKKNAIQNLINEVDQLEHISKKFKKKTVLNDISYTFEAGKIYGIYGINGSGKTMLLRIISGLVFPTSGSIIINGKTLHKEISFPDHMGLIIDYNPS